MSPFADPTPWPLLQPPGCRKAIIWAFIAGFSERFVPNAIDALTKAVPFR